MALNYTEIFGDIGKLIKLADEYREAAVGRGGLSPTKLTGTHDNATPSATVLTDSTAGWTSDTLIGMTVVNETDGSVGVITDNDGTTATVANGLSGGTGDNFEQNDVYYIKAPVPDVAANQDAIETQLSASGRYDILDGMSSTFDGQRDSLVSMANTIAAKVTERLLHRETVINELPGSPSTSDITDVLRELSRQMIDDAEDVNASNTTAPSMARDPGNRSTAPTHIFTTTKLDGYSAPASGMTSYPHYRDLESELAVPSELITVTCTQDRDNNGLPAGQEVMVIEGQPSPSDSLGWRTEGSGESVSLSTLDAYSIIQNREFETYDGSGNPTSWTVANGAPTTDFAQESTAANVFFGTSSLKFICTGGANAEFTQSVANGVILPNRHYILVLAIKGSGVTAGASFTVMFKSDSGGYTAVAGEKIDISGSDINGHVTWPATGADYRTFNWMTPSHIPDDLELQIKLSGATAGEFYIDSLAFGPYVYANGFGFAVKNGSAEMAINDRWTGTFRNDESIIQRFFRRYYGMQLPSVNDGSETIPDDWAT